MRVVPLALMVGLVFSVASCGAQEPVALEMPTTSVIIEALEMIVFDPAIVTSLQSTPEPAASLGFEICLSTETQPVFAFDFLLNAGQNADEFSRNLSDRTQGSTIDVEGIKRSISKIPSHSVVIPSDECHSNVGNSRIRLSVSQIVVDPRREWVDHPGFFVMAYVESNQGLIVERFVYWIEMEDHPEERVTGVLRIARGIDDIKLENTLLSG